MSLDKEKDPIGLKITKFIVANVFWYLLFSIIYWNIDCREWWLVKGAWGRFLLVILELLIYVSAFSDGKKS
jgi:glucan phosphoethanolaminetransferase (alkaline phosphatase superfamily)